MSKKRNALVHKPKTLPVRKKDFTLADLGALVLSDAEKRVQEQIQNTVTNIAEHVVSRIRYWQKEEEKCQHFIAEFRRKAAALEKGEFTVNKWDGTVTFNDHTLETLG